MENKGNIGSTVKLLIEALREEMEHYGSVLGLLQTQQEMVVERSFEELLGSVDALNREMERVKEMRVKRDSLRIRLARVCGLSESDSLESIAEQITFDEKPLFEGLLQDGRRTFVRVQQNARQNHLLIQRSMELMQDFIGALFPDAGAQTYSVDGQLLGGCGPKHQLYESLA
jgi:hypothetical protein